MTLPPNCLPAEPSASSCDLLATCGLPASSPDAAASGTPFASLMVQADATAANGAAAGTETTSPGANAPTLYPAIYYMTQLGTAQMQSQVIEAGAGIQPPAAELSTAVPVEEEPQDVLGSNESGSDENADGSLVLAYEFVAGQWVPQSSTPPAPEKVSCKKSGCPSDVDPAAPLKSFGQEQNAGQNGSLLGSVSAKTGDASKVDSATSFAAVQTKTAGLPEQARTIAAASTVEPITIASSKTAPSSVASLVTPSAPGSEKVETVSQIPLENAGSFSPPATSANGGGTQNPNQQFGKDRFAPLPTQEKIAAPDAPAPSESVSGVNSPTANKEKKSLFVNGEQVTISSKKVGTSTANREVAMPYFASNKLPSVELSTPASDGIQQNTTAETRTDTQISAQAPRLVQEIRTIADRISSIDRNSVEVRFDFSETERLSVRVDYRDGVVHTTFKTDSSQLRDVVAREWQAQNASAEQRSYRMADPVFTQTTSNRQDFTGGDGSGRQRAPEQQAQPGAPAFASPFGRGAGSTPSTVSPAARTARPETSLHLHALA